MSLRSLIEKRSIRRVGLLCGVLLASTLSGCFKGKDPWETTYPVSGVVTYKGRPVANADIAFFPEDDSFPEHGTTKGQIGRGWKIRRLDVCPRGWCRGGKLQSYRCTPRGRCFQRHDRSETE